MNQNDTVSLMAATLCAGLSEKAKTQPDQLFYDRIADQAWNLYNAVQFTSTEAAKRAAARSSSPR
jgi:hypothetical protein